MRSVYFFIIPILILYSCKDNMHDDARSLADKKCSLLWVSYEYDKVHDELMQSMRPMPVSEIDTSINKNQEIVEEGHLKREKELSDRLESLRQEIDGLNKGIEKLNEKFYKKYTDKELAEFTRDVKALVSNCNP